MRLAIEIATIQSVANQLLTGTAVRAEVVFGTPSKNCSGNGICLLSKYRPERPLRLQCPSVRGSIRANPSHRVVMLQFDTAQLPASVADRHLSGSHFVVEEPFSIPISILKSVGVSGRIAIAPGLYKLYHLKKSVVIKFIY